MELKRMRKYKRRSMNMKDRGESKYQTSKYRLLVKAVNRKRGEKLGEREEKRHGICFLSLL